MCRFPITICFILITLQAIDVIAEEKVEWSADLELGYGYDNNVSVDDVDLATEQGDQFADLSLSGGIDYNAGSGLNLSADLTLSEKRYSQFGEFDGRLSMASFGLEREVGALDLGMSLRHIDYRLDNSGFLSLTQLSPTLSWFPSKKTYVRAAYEYGDEKFDEEGSRDNRQHKISVRGYLFLNGLKRYLTLRLQYSTDNAESRLFDNDASEIALRYHQEFTFGAKALGMELAYRYLQRDYDELEHPVLLGFRQDRRRRFEVRLEWPLSESFTLMTRVYRNDNTSNLASADYDQRVYQLSVKYAL